VHPFHVAQKTALMDLSFCLYTSKRIEVAYLGVQGCCGVALRTSKVFQLSLSSVQRADRYRKETSWLRTQQNCPQPMFGCTCGPCPAGKIPQNLQSNRFEGKLVMMSCSSSSKVFVLCVLHEGV